MALSIPVDQKQGFSPSRSRTLLDTHPSENEGVNDSFELSDVEGIHDGVATSKEGLGTHASDV